MYQTINKSKIILLFIVLSVFQMLPTAQLFAADVISDPYELSLEENINTPSIPNKKRNIVKDAISHLRQQFEKAGFATGRLRQGDAFLITIPCSELFNSNSIQLSETGKRLLDKFNILDDEKDKYKLLIAVHTDDTGEDAYAESLTSERANAINDYFDSECDLKDMTIIPYGLGRDEPLNPNDSIKNRARNRRAEIYIIPLQTLFSKK